MTNKEINDFLELFKHDVETVRTSKYANTQEFFIKFLEGSKPNEPWPFIFEGSVDGATRFTNRLRSFLSRLRATLLMEGKKVYRFSILVGYRKLSQFETLVVLIRHTPNKDWMKTQAYLESLLVVEDSGHE